MKDKYIHITISEELKKKLIIIAKSKGLSLNSYIRMILTENVK